jgi:23S rRNA pseudouridine2605 synthase
VSLNGKKVFELGIKMNPKMDTLLVDGKLVRTPTMDKIHWIIVNKPRDVISTLKDEPAPESKAQRRSFNRESEQSFPSKTSTTRQSLKNYIPKAIELRLVPVGRMDRDTSGLMLLTNEVGWIHPLTHHSFRNYQRFEVVVRGKFILSRLKELAEGNLINPITDSALPPLEVYLLERNAKDSTSLLDFAFENQPSSLIFDVIDALKCEFVSSRRTEFATLKLKGLKKGDWKELNSKEINRLKDFCNQVKQNPSRKKTDRKLTSEDYEKMADAYEAASERDLK